MLVTVTSAPEVQYAEDADSADLQTFHFQNSQGKSGMAIAGARWFGDDPPITAAPGDTIELAGRWTGWDTFHIDGPADVNPGAVNPEAVNPDGAAPPRTPAQQAFSAAASVENAAASLLNAAMTLAQQGRESEAQHLTGLASSIGSTGDEVFSAACRLSYPRS